VLMTWRAREEETNEGRSYRWKPDRNERNERSKITCDKHKYEPISRSHRTLYDSRATSASVEGVTVQNTRKLAWWFNLGKKKVKRKLLPGKRREFRHWRIRVVESVHSSWKGSRRRLTGCRALRKQVYFHVCLGRKTSSVFLCLCDTLQYACIKQ
jgi:hypothetical protein